MRKETYPSLADIPGKKKLRFRVVGDFVRYLQGLRYPDKLPSVYHSRGIPLLAYYLY